MLVLTRRTGERIVITLGPIRIWITALDPRPGQVRIGIDAPRRCRVDREEIDQLRSRTT